MTDKPEFGTLGKSVHRDGEGFIAMAETEEWGTTIARALNHRLLHLCECVYGTDDPQTHARYCVVKTIGDLEAGNARLRAGHEGVLSHAAIGDKNDIARRALEGGE